MNEHSQNNSSFSSKTDPLALGMATAFHDSGYPVPGDDYLAMMADELAGSGYSVDQFRRAMGCAVSVPPVVPRAEAHAPTWADEDDLGGMTNPTLESCPCAAPRRVVDGIPIAPFR